MRCRWFWKCLQLNILCNFRDSKSILFLQVAGTFIGQMSGNDVDSLWSLDKRVCGRLGRVLAMILLPGAMSGDAGSGWGTFDVDELIEFLLEELALNIGTVLLVAAEVPLMMESVSGGTRMALLALACDALGSA